jgi:hypothetical protein
MSVKRKLEKAGRFERKGNSNTTGRRFNKYNEKKQE